MGLTYGTRELHTNTAYNAASDALNGEVVIADSAIAVMVWFDTTSYNGTANFEVSPDEISWFPLSGFAMDAQTTLISSLATPGETKLYLFQVPAYCRFRVKLSGGSAGSLTVKARLSYF